MGREIKYTTDGKCSVFAGKIEIARSYLGEKGYTARILQGMDRTKTVAKIIRDCPEFAKANNMELGRGVFLFSN